jgi:hypothetical protein
MLLEVQDHNYLISHLLLAETDIRGQPRQLVHVGDSILRHCEKCVLARWGKLEQFS